MIAEEKIEIIDLDSGGDLVPYWSGISELFSESFGKQLARDLWNWAYQDNPYGEPLVSIAVFENRVVGHYAVIPFNLKSSKKPLAGYLSMTTMVAQDFRRLKLFQALAERVYSRIMQRKKPAVVFGFPNDNSAPGFVKRLKWNILESYSVAKVKPNQLGIVKDLIQGQLDSGGYKIDLSSEKVKQWRQNKPSQQWLISDGLGFKSSEFGNDLMYLEHLNDFERVVGNSGFNAILPVGSDERFEVAFPYRFGYRSFNMDEDPKFIVEMAMSDIF